MQLQIMHVLSHARLILYTVFMVVYVQQISDVCMLFINGLSSADHVVFIPKSP